MLLCRGPWRKLTLLPLSLLLVGWLLYLVGFSILMINTEGGAAFEHLPYYVATAAPPILMLLAVLHITLYGLPSALLGSLAAVSSVVCFTCSGYVLYSSALVLYNYIHFSDAGDKLEVRYVLMLAGTLMTSLSWMFIGMLWTQFSYKRPWRGDEGSDYVVDEDGTMRSPPPPQRDPFPFAGIARKVAIVFLFLQAGSWCVLVSGIDSQVDANSSLYEFEDNPIEVPLPFSKWTICVIGVLLIIAAPTHAWANRGASAVAGIFASILSILYLACIGHAVWALGIDIHSRCMYDEVDDCFVSMLPRYELYQICGGLGTCVFWACVLALWPFYYKPVENVQEMRRNIERRRGYYMQNHNSEESVPLLYHSSGDTHDARKPSSPHT